MSAQREPNLWYTSSEPQPEQVRLVCFAYAGGGASVFASWPRWLPDVEISAIQLPGRQNRFLEQPYTRVARLVEALGTASPSLFDRPFAFFGHSMGAILCFEMTRWLRRTGRRLPELLFVSARRAPQIPDTDTPRHLMAEADFVSEIRRLKATPEEILTHPELLQLILPCLRADMELCETYEYFHEPPVACPIVAFAGLDDDEETVERMEAWRQQTLNRFILHAIQGDHFFIHSNEQHLVNLLRSELANVRKHRLNSRSDTGIQMP